MRTHQWKKFFISREFRIIGACLAILPALGVHFFQAGDLTPDRQHAFVAKVVTTLLTQHHYSHPVLNDSASSVQLDQYLEYLDANRLYFLAADLAEFERYRFKLDDELASGNVETAFLIFNKFKRRANERFTYINNLLEHEFDFSLSEYYMPNREGVPWVHTVEELNELWRKRLKHEALSLKLAGKNWPEIATTLKKRYANLQRRIEEFDAENVFQSYMNALSESFDPHTSYLSPITSQNFNIEMSLSLEGIGARLVSEDEYTKVFEIVTGGPADRSKQLFANDKIVGVAQGEDGPMIDVIGMKLDDVVQMIRGKKGTVVRLEIISASSPPGSPTKTISLVRDKIVLTDREVRSDTIEWSHNSRKHKIGVITIPTFYADLEAQQRGEQNYKSTTRDVRRLLKALQNAKIDGLLIDLRRNGGGSLQEAVALTGLFIKEGPVVQVRKANGVIEQENDPDPTVVYDGPLVVLVDRVSASASEIFAAAIQDYKRGVVLGSQTFGKGTVQNLLDLNRIIRSNDGQFGQLKITMAKFYRVSGGTTQHRGVIPDIVFPSYYDEIDFGESSQKYALPWDQIEAAPFIPEDRVSKYLATLRANAQTRMRDNPEFRYMLEDVERSRQERARNLISLQETQRRAGRQALEAQNLARVNERRKAKGLPAFKAGEEIPKDEKTPDAWHEESLRVLADLIVLSQANQQASPSIGVVK